MRGEKGLLMDGVAEYAEGYGVRLVQTRGAYDFDKPEHEWRGHGRLVIKSWNEGGHNSTEVDLLQLLEWVRTNRPDLMPNEARATPPCRPALPITKDSESPFLRCLGTQEITVSRSESGFDRACDLAHSLALAKFGIDEYGDAESLPGWDRSDCCIEVELQRYVRVGGDHVYQFSAKAIKELEEVYESPAK